MEAMVEAVGEGAEVGWRVLAEGEVLVRAVEGGLQVAQQRVDPIQARQFARLALTHDDAGVGAAGIDDAAEAGQTIAEHFSAGQHRAARPIGDGAHREAGHLRELGIHRHALRVELHGGHERHLVGRAATTGAGALAPEVGVVDDAAALQRHLRVGRRHDGHHLVVQQPGGAVAHPELALERQRRQAGLGLTDQEHGQEPHAQRQLAALEHSAGHQRGLPPAPTALQHRAATVRNPVGLTRRAVRAREATGPALALQLIYALSLRAVARQELRQRQTALELDGVARHACLREIDKGTLDGRRLMA